MTRVIGLMSGTSVDGIDAALVEISGSDLDLKIELLAGATYGYPTELREKILAVCTGTPLSMAELAALDDAIAFQFAQAALAIGSGHPPAELIGSHGQTVYHRPLGVKGVRVAWPFGQGFSELKVDRLNVESSSELKVGRLNVVRVRAAEAEGHATRTALPKAWPFGQGFPDNLQPDNLQAGNLPFSNAKGEQPATETNLGQKATLREQPDNLQPDNLQPTNLGQKATLREQPDNLQPTNLGQKATLREQPTNLGQKATLREQPANLGQKATLREQPANLGQKATLREQPANLGQKATLREQPDNLQPANLGQKATLREQPANLGQKATLREQPTNLQPANLQPVTTLGYSLQLGRGEVIAEITGIKTISNFRVADIAAGGEGAPLVPKIDACLLRSSTHNRCIQNIGGISNVTYLPVSQGNWLEQVYGWDTGPGNALLDLAVEYFTNGRKTYDYNGEWAASGTPCEALVEQWLAQEFFKIPPPKSTGRELFSLDYLKQCLGESEAYNLAPADFLATLTELTVASIVESYRNFLPQMPDEVLLCGGGASNLYLKQRLQIRLDSVPVLTTDQVGLSRDFKEAIAFAVLAHWRNLGIPGNLPQVTGASEAVCLGNLYSPRSQHQSS
ncbi:anhydro-N-acetylmuramic acid kinase [Moorena sp. SIO3E8]|uniref:anhydro-N-acetylmuramic acid kinase n=1 Tax=Moorena sp. SIO3E8 TaxID=2607830 RepID=UPI0025F57ECF|nr:anhydro-N-acetylmuramic acid kinase [Moorena sp. SIO3E8]